MKFLCDNCKAKYQIGDEKVAGKTVRMKCRRCGHSITVSSKVTESSVSRPFPLDPSASALDPAPDSGRFPTTGEAQAPAAPRRDEDESENENESTQIMQMPLVRPQGPTPIRPAAGLRAAPPPPRPSGAPLGGLAARAPAPPRPGAASALRAPSGAPARDMRTAPMQQVVQPVRPNAAVEPAAGTAGGVAAAFQRAVADPHATASRTPPHEDWYVGVGGVPIGPVRVDVIREKALLSQVDGDSLVWREGFDEWQPLKKFPELLEVVHSARMARLAHTSNKPSAPPPAEFVAQPSSAFVPAAATAEPVGQQPRAPAAPAASAQAPSVMTDPFAKPSMLDRPAAPGPSRPAPDPPEPGANLFGAGAVAPDPFAAVAAPVAAAGPTSAEMDAILARPRGMHPMAYAFIAMAAVFGGVAAYFLFFKPPPQAQIVVVEKTVPAQGAAPAATASAEVAAAPTAEATAAPTQQRVASGGAPRGSGKATTTAPATAPGPGNPIDTSGFTNGGVAGPSAAGPTPGGAAGGGQLSQGEIQGTISSNQARIRRGCWDSALASRSANAPTTARVNASITIGASGRVENVSTSGADAFPGLSGCIADKLRSLKFPASGGSTTVSVPFVFAAQ